MVLHKNLTDGDLNLHVPKLHAHVEADITDLDKYTQAEVDALFAILPDDYVQKIGDEMSGDLSLLSDADIMIRLDNDPLAALYEAYYMEIHKGYFAQGSLGAGVGKLHLSGLGLDWEGTYGKHFVAGATDADYVRLSSDADIGIRFESETYFNEWLTITDWGLRLEQDLLIWGKDSGATWRAILGVNTLTDTVGIGSGFLKCGLVGSVARPTYNGGDLALLSDAGGGGTDPDAVHLSVANEFSPVPFATVGSGDRLLMEDADDAYNKKRTSVDQFALANHDHVEADITDLGAYLDEPAADLLYSQLGHTHLVADVTDFDPSDYLLLTGGVLTGNIQFPDDLEGIQFWDTASAYFNAVVMNLAEGTLQIGDNAPGMGGPPMVHANSPIVRMGYNGLGGFASLEMWHEDAGGFIPIITLISDNPGDPLDIGVSGGNALNFYGSETRPTYESADLALLSDVPGPGYFAHLSPGVGDLNLNVLNGVFTSVSGSGSDTGIVTVWEMITAVRGGSATPTWTFTAVAPAGGVVAGSPNADPSAITIAFGQADAGGFFPINLTVSDGTTTRKQQTFVQVSDTDSW